MWGRRMALAVVGGCYDEAILRTGGVGVGCEVEVQSWEWGGALQAETGGCDE